MKEKATINQIEVYARLSSGLFELEQTRTDLMLLIEHSDSHLDPNKIQSSRTITNRNVV